MGGRILNFGSKEVDFSIWGILRSNFEFRIFESNLGYFGQNLASSEINFQIFGPLRSNSGYCGQISNFGSFEVIFKKVD